jgi:hypothetical protein
MRATPASSWESRSTSPRTWRVLSICTGARLPHVEAYRRWAHLWRGIPDTADQWSSLLTNGFMSEDYLQEDWRPHIGPGAWYDLDMFALGPQFHTPTSSCPNRLSRDEQITHMTAWALSRSAGTSRPGGRGCGRVRSPTEASP